RSQGVERRVQLELPGFLGLAAIVSSTDLIATVPRTIGETLARMGPIKIFPCPLKVPTFTVKQYWHVRYHHDPGLRWLRGVCAQLLARSEPLRGKAHSGREPRDASARNRPSRPQDRRDSSAPASGGRRSDHSTATAISPAAAKSAFWKSPSASCAPARNVWKTPRAKAAIATPNAPATCCTIAASVVAP